MKRWIDYFDHGVFCHPSRLCLTGEGGDFSYIRAASWTHAIGHDLIDNGYGHGHVMSIIGPNCSQVLLALLGAVRVGTIWCNLNLRNTEDSNLKILTRNGCEVLYFHSSMQAFAERALDQVPTMKRIVCLGGPCGDLPNLDDIYAANAGRGEVPYIDIQPEDIVVQTHTGGTTGEPKITEQPNRMLCNMMLTFATVFRYEEAPVNLAVAPLTHASGPIAFAHTPHGGTNVVMARADPEAIMQAVQERKVTTLFLPPTVTYAILSHPRLGDYDLSSIKYWVSTAAPIAPSKLEEAARQFGDVMINIYGQTESGFPVTCLHPWEVREAIDNPDLRHRLKSCGRPTLFTQVAILDDDGNHLPVGEVGEICSRGENLISGFVDDPDGIEKIRTEDGWQRSGDVGYRDEEGYIYISDRKRDMIVSGGFNIYPIEIESLLQEHPDIQECAVIGVPDKKWGEAVKAVVLLKPGATLSEKEILEYCHSRLGGLKSPKSVDFPDELPLSPVGKVLKREIRDKYWAGREDKIT